jgi:hypothetical protein
MGLAYNALDDDDSDLDAYDLSQTMKPSARSGIPTDPKIKRCTRLFYWFIHCNSKRCEIWSR